MPAKEIIAAAGSRGQLRNDLRIHISLNDLGAVTALGIINDIAEFRGSGDAVYTVEVQIGFCQTARDQTALDLIARLAPGDDGIQEFRTGLAVNDGAAEGSVALRPCRAAVIGEAQKGVKLVLIQRQTEGIDQLIDGLLCHCHIGSEQSVSFLFRDAFLRILGKFRAGLGNVAAITDRILRIVEDGLGEKTLMLLDQCDQFLACLHIRGSGNRNGDCKDRAYQQRNRQNHTDKFLIHRHLLLGGSVLILQL